MAPIKDYSQQFQLSNRDFEFDIEMYNHQQTKFFVLFNQLLECRNDDGIGVQITEVIEELDDYSQTYFHLEERAMLKNNYPLLGEHILQHRLFIFKVEEFRIAQTYKNQEMIEKMIIILRKWFFMHVYETDRKYHDTINSNLFTPKYNLNFDFDTYYNKPCTKGFVFQVNNNMKMNNSLSNQNK